MPFCPACQRDFPDTYNSCPHDGTVLLPKNKVGKYEIVGRIGEGGMGSVYRAINPDTRAPVALKLLNEKAASLSVMRARFQREAEAVAALRTRHVIRIFDFGSDGDTLFLVMELLEGKNLRDEIAGVAVPVDRTLAILDGALRGLAAAHRAEVTHRDLKPENIFVAETDDGEVVKVLDFGIARVADTDLTNPHDLMGTPAYMAREQVLTSFGAVGPHTDTYAMGVIAYEMLTGLSPFVGSPPTTVSEVLGRVVESKFEPIDAVMPELAEDLRAVIRQAMAGDPADRYADADDMYRALQETDDGRRLMAPSSGSARASGNRRAAVDVEAATKLERSASSGGRDQQGGPSRSRWPLWVGGLVAVGGAAAVAIAMSGGSGSDDGGGAPKVAAIDAAVRPTVTPPAADAAEVRPPDGMVALAGGTFEFGSEFFPRFATALPARSITIEPFWLDTLEVHDSDMRPRAGMTYKQAAQHCDKLGKRLPTEEEWEFAARRSQLPGGHLRVDNKLSPALVGEAPGDVTVDGIHDLRGNLSEWTSSPWVTGDGGSKPAMRVVRGSSFAVRKKLEYNSTIFARVAVAPDVRDPEVGFRCAMDAPKAKAR